MYILFYLNKIFVKPIFVKPIKQVFRSCFVNIDIIKLDII